MERIEPIRRDDAARGVPPIAPVARRDRERRDDDPARRRHERRAPSATTRDDDGTPHVDIRA